MTDLLIRAPTHRAAELSWVCEVLFARWLGLSYRIEAQAQPVVQVQVLAAGVAAGAAAGAAAGGIVQWTDAFFAQADARWLQPESLPALPPPTWPLPDDVLRQRIGQDALPRFFGDGRFEQAAGVVTLPIDLSGSAFFVLSRYEEAVAGAAQDRHGRYPGRQSVAQRSGMALRPLVDEWLELLWWALQQVAPGLRRRERRPQVWVSCDVDAPFSPGAHSAALALRQTASHLVNDRSPRLAALNLLNAAASRVGVTRFDPFDTFDRLLDLNERAGNRLAFFFLSVKNPQVIDGCYELDDARIAALVSRIVQRGHEVGLHGSYFSVEQPKKLAAELADLKLAVARAGGAQSEFGGRQHYLRWRMADTARTLDTLGLTYDSTLGFPDIAGFRCGTCHAYPMFDLAAGRALALLQRPLVLMEATVVTSTYLALGLGDEARALMMGLRESCRRFGGEFALLWHNSSFSDARAWELYEALIQPMAPFEVAA